MISSTKSKILIFDREEAYRKTLAMHLRMHGYDVIEADSLSVCPVPIDEICSRKEGDPCANMIISSGGVSDAEGFDFLEKQIRKGCKAEQMALILQSQSSDMENRAKELGIHIFRKPMGLVEVREWIEQVLPVEGDGTASGDS